VTVLVPGQIDPGTGICVSSPVLGWRKVVVREVMEDLLGVPVAVLNPTTASALGAARSRGHRDMIMVFFDLGVGCGVVRGGTVLLGADGAAGEIGHIRVAGSLRRCRCGEIGCLETITSGCRISERVTEVTEGGITRPHGSGGEPGESGRVESLNGR
jgi:predicted NBD/HSP70 family sugar kinase